MMYFVICPQCCIIYLFCLYGALLHGSRGAKETGDLRKTKVNNFATSRTRSKINKEAKLQCKSNTIMFLFLSFKEHSGSKLQHSERSIITGRKIGTGS